MNAFFSEDPIQRAAERMAVDAADLGLIEHATDHLRSDREVMAAMLLFMRAGFVVACRDLGIDPVQALAASEDRPDPRQLRLI